jgi:proline iminopeptidase
MRLRQEQNSNTSNSSMPMLNRRKFVAAGVTSLASVMIPALAWPIVTVSAENSGNDEVLNPQGIRTAGIKMIPVVNGKYKVWTKRIGHGAIKVLILHGGPGVGHEYLEALESFLPEAGIEMYYYDQLGNSYSDQPDDPSLWTLERYVEEVEEVRIGLGLDQFVLYGHSWGGILAIEYALRFQQHLSGLVISNMAAGIKAYLKRTAALKQLLSPASRQLLDKIEQDNDYDNPDYSRIMMDELYPQMLCRIKPWPNSVNRSFQHMNTKIYEQMQGKSEFVVTGNLKDWDRWDSLHEIKVRTLTIGARYDEMDPEDMKKMAVLMPNARFAYCPNGSHFCMWDDQAAYFKQLLGFLKSL